LGKHVGRRAALATVLASMIAFAAAAPAAAQAPPVGTSASSVDLRTVPGATPYGLGHAIPLAGARPDWFTPALRATVLAADGVPVQAPPDAPLPSEVGIRPGSWMIEPAGCTMNFVFQSGGALGIGTAGHCAEVGDEVVLLTLAPGTENPVLVNIGQTAISHDNDIGDDFALVAIRPELNEWVFPTMAVVGGPCGQYFGSGPETVWHYGHGLAIGTGGTPRAGVALTWQDDAYGWDGAGIFGDSGSGVRVTDLKAAGNLTHLVVDTNWLPSFIVGTRIGKIDQINGGWTMVNSSLCGGAGSETTGGGKGRGNGKGGKR
jgi:hypothetical protein